MTMTLGEALAAEDEHDIDIRKKPIDDGLEKAKNKLIKEGKRFSRKSLIGPLKKAISAALDVALDEMIGGAWSRVRELQKYADPEQTPPGDVNTVTLSDHTIESVHEPSVDVVVSNVTVKTFQFNVAARLHVKGANLVVQDGKIQEIQLAKLELGGSVLLEDHTLLEKNLAEIEVPAVMRLENPIPILPGRA